MPLRIADTFTTSLARLNNDEQKAVKTTAFDLQVNPASPGLSFHKLDRAKDKNFGSVRVNDDIRLIIHKLAGNLLLCYVDHHEQAYAWAQRRKLEIHPSTGAAQLVEIRETVQEILIPSYVDALVKKRPLFEKLDDTVLLGHGVPQEWLADVRACDGEDALLSLAVHLPAEAADALLILATGGQPTAPVAHESGSDPFLHPDAQRRFRMMSDREELERALEYPWDRWAVFLHPDQHDWVERDHKGPARVGGSAGTGKTIVALHRAAHLARKNPDARILLTTFSAPLARALHGKLQKLLSGQPRLIEQIEVEAIGAVGLRLYQSRFGKVKLANADQVAGILGEFPQWMGGLKFSTAFLMAEWEQVIDTWQINDWEAYRRVVRMGRKSRLSEPQRAQIWSIFESAIQIMQDRNLVTESGLFGRLSTALSEGGQVPYAFAVVDEAQDLSISQLRFLAMLGGNRENSLFFAGDIGQRIFQQPFSWKELGVDIRGRSRTLRVNYRTSHQIRARADRLLDPQVRDGDGKLEKRDDTISLFNGPAPIIQRFRTVTAETQAVADWLAQQTKAGVSPAEIALFVRSEFEISRAVAAANAAQMAYKVLDDTLAQSADTLAISTMHLAKGLEFRAVAVMACDDEVIPSQERIESVGDEGDLQDVCNTERHLLYVACTRARDDLLITCLEPGSEFLDDMGKG